LARGRVIGHAPWNYSFCPRSFLLSIPNPAYGNLLDDNFLHGGWDDGVLLLRKHSSPYKKTHGIKWLKFIKSLKLAYIEFSV